ncbi:MAG: bifunctional UDP-N-acetylglucosamine diphosphorylase/glucosamine-1-phosphate N-acetyltransferase GlmU [Pseudomonadota bacterium]
MGDHSATADVRGTQALAIVLAAGKGTRMKSAVPKVLHEVAGRPLIGHVLETLAASGRARPCVVVAPDAQGARVADVARHLAPGAAIAVQQTQNGTADAVLAAREQIAAHNGPVFVLFADTPLVRPATLDALSQSLSDGADVAVLGFEPADPTGYGRILTDAGGNVTAIREHKDATEAERSVRLCNSGVMAFAVSDLLGLLDAIGNDNAKGEFYLTDVVELARARGLKVAATLAPAEDVLGVNSRVQLAEAEAVFQARARHAAMEAGVTMIAPDTVYFSADTVLGRDIILEPNVFFGPGVTLADGVTIRANSHLEGARVGEGAVIGPFARLRPGANLGAKVRIGNFVEVKNVDMGDGAKANHLAYLGDGTVGTAANIGAGTIFCNYDGFRKHRTEIGDEAFVGSNSALVAPVKVGAGAYVGSGSVITKNVPDGALAVARSSQEVRENWAQRFRARMSAKKAGGKD